MLLNRLDLDRGVVKESELSKAYQFLYYIDKVPR